LMAMYIGISRNFSWNGSKNRIERGKAGRAWEKVSPPWLTIGDVGTGERYKLPQFRNLAENDFRAWSLKEPIQWQQI